ncbi:MAG: chloramphenicol acetyltransferase [Bacteroidota bacterium]
MKTKIDLENWNRKEHFEFFSQFDEPFHSVTVQMDCTNTYNESKENGTSFFLNYLHRSLVAANSVRAFRLRIIDGDVFEFDHINASPTIGRTDGTFGFSYMDYHADFNVFLPHALKVTEKIRQSAGLGPAAAMENVIHYSSLPWLKFTALSHARSYSYPDSAPKISFGKMTEKNGRKTMPMSVHVHHGLVDGSDVGLYVKKFQELL